MSVKLKATAKAQTQNAPIDTKAVSRASLGLVTLEPRILLDAAGFITGADIAMENAIAQDVQAGVDAIFGESSSGDVNPTGAPLDGPWLDEITADNADTSNNGDPTGAPLDGPWLDQLSADDNGGEGEDPTSAPLDGPWLDEVSVDDTDSSDDDPTSAPLDGPWLDEVTLEGEENSGDGDPTGAPLDGPWL
ncbi:hypothetical protein [Hellea balneolensis]|uniref:hypothetical protein n=1 Tax=Hellea balneolensis TaxID=287478 RepID=UPI0012B87F07|nr:hypothetical protein [Hellea balneolensis]